MSSENGSGGGSERGDGGVGMMDLSENGGHCDWACGCGNDGASDHVVVDAIFVVYRENGSVGVNDHSCGHD